MATLATDAATVVLPIALALQSACWAAISVVLVTVVPVPCDVNETATPATAAEAEVPLDGPRVDARATALAPFHTRSVASVTLTADHGAVPAALTPTAALAADPRPVASAVTAVDAFMHVAKVRCRRTVAEGVIPAAPPPIVAARPSAAAAL